MAAQMRRLAGIGTFRSRTSARRGRTGSAACLPKGVEPLHRSALGVAAAADEFAGVRRGRAQRMGNISAMSPSGDMPAAWAKWPGGWRSTGGPRRDDRSDRRDRDGATRAQPRIDYRHPPDDAVLDQVAAIEMLTAARAVSLGGARRAQGDAAPVPVVACPPSATHPVAEHCARDLEAPSATTRPRRPGPALRLVLAPRLYAVRVTPRRRTAAPSGRTSSRVAGARSRSSGPSALANRSRRGSRAGVLRTLPSKRSTRWASSWANTSARSASARPASSMTTAVEPFVARTPFRPSGRPVSATVSVPHRSARSPARSSSGSAASSSCSSHNGLSPAHREPPSGRGQAAGE